MGREQALRVVEASLRTAYTYNLSRLTNTLVSEFDRFRDNFLLPLIAKDLAEHEGPYTEDNLKALLTTNDVHNQLVSHSTSAFPLDRIMNLLPGQLSGSMYRYPLLFVLEPWGDGSHYNSKGGQIIINLSGYIRQMLKGINDVMEKKLLPESRKSPEKILDLLKRLATSRMHALHSVLSHELTHAIDSSKDQFMEPDAEKEYDERFEKRDMTLHFDPRFMFEGRAIASEIRSFLGSLQQRGMSLDRINRYPTWTPGLDALVSRFSIKDLDKKLFRDFVDYLAEEKVLTKGIAARLDGAISKAGFEPAAPTFDGKFPRPI